MPFYDYELTVAAGTTVSAPAHAVAALNKGVVTRVEVLMPPGCAGLVSTWARRENHQVWPSNPDGRFRAEAVTIAFSEDYLLADNPLSFDLYGIAPQARFQHIITWRFELMPQKQYEDAQVTAGLIPRLARFLGVK